MFVGYFHHRCGNRGAAESALDLSDRIAAESGLQQTEFISRCFRTFHCVSWNDVAGAARALDGLDARLSDNKPMLIILHGLSGGSHEIYLRHAIAPLIEQGNWEICVVNSRGCAMSKITTGILYNARATWDVRQVSWVPFMGDTVHS
jgi:predicted alpha/beta-fold hydrolase